MPTIKFRISLLMWLLALGSCANQGLEKSFFNQARENRVERLHQYSLEKQYRIFRYGCNKIEPPVLELAIPIASRGAAAIPFLVAELKESTDDETVRDIMSIFERMKMIKSYAVKDDFDVMQMLSIKVSQMKDREWRFICTEMLKDLQSPSA